MPPPPIFYSAKDYMNSLTNNKRANNSKLANVLNQIGVRCTPCMESKINSLRTASAREDYLRLLKISPENIQLVNSTFDNG